MFSEISFYILSVLLIFFAGAAVLLPYTAYSLLSLSIAFFSISAFFLLLGIELLALLFLFLYASAIGTSLFLIAKKIDAQDRKPLTYTLSLIGFLFFLLLLFVAFQWKMLDVPQPSSAQSIGEISALFLSEALYTKYLLLFELSGFVLFIAMTISIMLIQPDKKELEQ
ncbi:MAG: NADH-quinone oxidoreductase subunit J [Alphaproteobacteria bacterium]